VECEKLTTGNLLNVAHCFLAYYQLSTFAFRIPHFTIILRCRWCALQYLIKRLYAAIDAKHHVLLLHCESKKTNDIFRSQLYQMFADFQNFFTIGFSKKFAIKHLSCYKNLHRNSFSFLLNVIHIIWHVLRRHTSDLRVTACHVWDLLQVLYLPAKQCVSSMSAHSLRVSVSHFRLLKWKQSRLFYQVYGFNTQNCTH